MTSEDKKSIRDSVLENILNNKVWHLPLSLHTCSQTGQLADNAAQARSNTVLVCLLCEAVASTALCVNSEAFRQCLFQCLYPLIERSGSQHEYISLAGLQAMGTIVQVCRYGSIAQLIADNIDYLSYHITIQLRQGTPLVLDAIKVILEQANEHVLPCIEDILEHALREGPAMFVDENKKISHLNMYLVFVTRIRQWHCKDIVEIDLKTAYSPEDYVKDLLEYEKLKNISENYEDFETMEDDEQIIDGNEEEPKEEEAKPTPKYISMIEAILNTCLHFLPSRTLNHQVIKLKILLNTLHNL